MQVDGENCEVMNPSERTEEKVPYRIKQDNAEVCIRSHYPTFNCRFMVALRQQSRIYAY